MYKHYIKIAWRTLSRNKAFSFINILGLAIGLCVCLLIVLFVKDELSYDKYNKNADRIYRLDADLFFNGSAYSAADSPEPLAAALKRECPLIQEVVRLYYRPDISVKKDNRNIQDHNVIFSDSTLFKVFTLPMIEGNPSTALSEPNSIVIDETIAKKYFNTTNAVGKNLVVDGNTNCKITGVIKDVPSQSHIHFRFIRPRRQDGPNANFWLSNNVYSYILVSPAAAQQQVQQYVNKTVDKYIGAQLQTLLHTSLNDVQQKGNHFIYHVMPLADIHLHSDKAREPSATGNIQYVYIFSVIAIFILLIACSNFMNLSTARSAGRAKEIGVRKVAGSTRTSLITQFLTESVLISLISMIIAILTAAALLPLFNSITQKNMQTGILFSPRMLLVIILFILFTGCLAGSYPAFYLSSFNPVKVLKGKVVNGFKSSWLRSVLVVFQFCTSIILIVGTIVIYNQLHYIQNKKLGYDRHQILVLHNVYALGNNMNSFRNNLMNMPGVENVTVSGSLPTAPVNDREGWLKDATLDAAKTTLLNNYFIDRQYIPTLGMRMVQGRNFSDKFPSDSSGIILNETAAKLLGFGKNPLNQTLYRINGNNADGSMHGDAYHVIGIVKDFNFTSLHDNIGPLIMQLGNDRSGIVVRLNTDKVSSVIGNIRNKWSSAVATQPFDYTFMDADFSNIYHSEQQTGKLFIAFAALAIFIACLGLFGLVTYAAEQRTKEIGVRKVLGASTRSIVALLSKDFAKLILIAMLIAFPVAWWGTHKWLQSFAYRASLGWWIFLFAGIAAIVIAFATICWQAIKAARANPVKSLKTE